MTAQIQPPQAVPIPCTAWRGTPEREVCLCAIGVHTPLGLDVRSSAAAVRAGISAISLHPSFVDRFGEPVGLACDAFLACDLPLVERLGRMLASALDQVCPVPWRSTMPVDLWLGLPEPRPGMTGSVAGDMRSRAWHWASARLPVSSIHALPTGHAAGLMALQAAAGRISSGASECCLVAAVDSYHDGETLSWLDERGRLMSSANRNGFPPGEAAGACLLVSRSAATQLGLPILGRLVAAATATEPVPLDSEEVCVGLGLSTVVARLAEALSLPQSPITATYCDLNGERHRNEEFGYTLLRHQLAFVDAHDYLCPADCWGDVGAASGLLYAALAAASAQRGDRRAGLPILWAGSDGGLRSAALLSLHSAVSSP